MWKGEYHMEVRRVNDFSFPFIHPDLFQHCLTVGAVPVTAGIIVDVGMSAAGTLGDVISQLSRFTVQDCAGSFFLNL